MNPKSSTAERKAGDRTGWTGDRGGVDKHCHIEVRLARVAAVNVEERHEDLRAAIDIAVDRLEEAVHRHLERTRSKSRDRGRKEVRNHKLGV